MSFPELLALAAALAMDALAVSIAAGITLGRPRPAQLLRMPLAFGRFQAAMPAAGWLLGLSVRRLIERWDHWIAFALLVFVGFKLHLLDGQALFGENGVFFVQGKLSFFLRPILTLGNSVTASVQQINLV